MPDPVFVIHGVANRDRDGFTAAVEALQSATGVDMVPVYWGDLGAEDHVITAALPTRDTKLMSPVGPGDILRDETPDILPSYLFPAQPLVLDQLRIVDAALRGELGSDEGPLRADRGPGTPTADEVMDCLADEWPDTRWLSRTDDAALLAEAGRALARVLLDADTDADTSYGYDGLRGPSGPGTGRWRDMLRRRLRDLDRITGAAIGAAAGRVNQAVRTRILPGTTRFLGDVLVYQRHRDVIHARVRERIDEIDPSLGRGPQRPVRLVAHSLGGVIAVDMATAGEPLWTDHLLTFGSQAAFFHICDPRGGQLLPYAGQSPVRLPASLGRWTNLWEPMDMLAFAASRVFRLDDGTEPVDRAVPHSTSSGLWTHSAYWDLPAVAVAIAEAMEGGSSAADERMPGEAGRQADPV
ncbi:hypothetical protein [Streptomyces sp. NPDC059378]|uniref:hypothetical protein n=1 Tax=Streptomyces sp. NPDC059378 TaxID=3346815 RepID=UPI003686A585